MIRITGAYKVKKLVLLFTLIAAPVFAQSNAQAPTVAELKLQLAQKDVQIAQLKVSLIKAQAQLAFQEAQTELAAAQKALYDATPKPEPKPEPKR